MTEAVSQPDSYDAAWERLDKQGRLTAEEIRHELGRTADSLGRPTSFPVDSQGRRTDELPSGVVSMKDASPESRRALEETRALLKRNRQ